MKINDYFDIREFVPRIIWNNYEVNSTWFIQKELIDLMVIIRDYFNEPIYINNWHWGGTAQHRGYRTPSTRIGAHYSQHKLGNACDFNVRNVSPKLVKDEILDNENYFMTYGLRALESQNTAKTWTHIDLRWTPFDHIFIFLQ